MPVASSRSVENGGSGCIFPTLPDAHENQGSGLDFHAFLKQLELFCNTISKNKLEEIREITTRAHERRFRRRKEPRYGSINKGFTEQELQVFLRALRSEKFRLLFKYQAFLGLSRSSLNSCSSEGSPFIWISLTRFGVASITAHT